MAPIWGSLIKSSAIYEVLLLGALLAEHDVQYPCIASTDQQDDCRSLLRIRGPELRLFGSSRRTMKCKLAHRCPEQ